MEGSHGYVYRMQDKNKNTALFLVPDRKGSSNLKKLIKKYSNDRKLDIKCTDKFIKDNVQLLLRTVEVNKKDLNIFKNIISELYNQLLVMGYRDTLNEIIELFDGLRIEGDEEGE